MQRVVHLKNPRAVTVFREPASVAGRKTAACDAQQLVRRDVAKNCVVIRECRQIFDARGSFHSTAERGQMSAQSIGDGLRAAARNGPAYRMRGYAKKDAKGGAQRLIEAEEGMGGETGEESLSAFAAERIGKRFC